MAGMGRMGRMGRMGGMGGMGGMGRRTFCMHCTAYGVCTVWNGVVARAVGPLFFFPLDPGLFCDPAHPSRRGRTSSRQVAVQVVVC